MGIECPQKQNQGLYPKLAGRNASHVANCLLLHVKIGQEPSEDRTFFTLVGMCVFKCVSWTSQPGWEGHSQPSHFGTGPPDKESSFKPVSTGCLPSVTGPRTPVRPQGCWVTQHPPIPVPAHDFPVERTMMPYPPFLLAAADSRYMLSCTESLYDKATLQSLFWADFALRGSW